MVGHVAREIEGSLIKNELVSNIKAFGHNQETRGISKLMRHFK